MSVQVNGDGQAIGGTGAGGVVVRTTVSRVTVARVPGSPELTAMPASGGAT